MPDRLVASHPDGYISPLGLVNRLKSEFPYVETDGEAGRYHVLQTIQRLKAERSRRQADREMAERLDRVKNRALFVCFGDEAGSDLSLLSTYIIPGMPLVFEYASDTHEHVAQPLLERCATALGYEIRKDRRKHDQPGYGGQERRHSIRERRRFIERRFVLDRRKSNPHLGANPI